MLLKRYLLSLIIALSIFALESCKPDSVVHMPTVTNTHVTDSSGQSIGETPQRTQVIGEVTEASGPKTAVSKYPLHNNILATVFWVGEEATPDNDFIANDVSAWDTAWTEHFGGIDNPNSRNGFYPSGFKPKENPFYFALPYGDYTESGQKTNVNKIYWYQPFSEDKSILKNRWIKIIANGKVAYGQWEDVGPFEEDDVDYVFGSKASKQEVGLDVSPAIRDYLGLSGRDSVSWQFVDEAEVPSGPWKEIVTRSDPYWH